MKFIKYSVFFLLQLGCFNLNHDFLDDDPETRLIKRFSEKLKRETGGRLYCYGTNLHATEENIKRYGKKTFKVFYFIPKGNEEIVSLEEARCLLTSIMESFLEEVNSDQEVKAELKTYPLTADWIDLCIQYTVENDKDLETDGITATSTKDGIITYRIFDTHERKRGLIWEEPYEKALEIVQAQGCLKHF